MIGKAYLLKWPDISGKWSKEFLKIRSSNRLQSQKNVFLKQQKSSEISLLYNLTPMEFIFGPEGVPLSSEIDLLHDLPPELIGEERRALLEPLDMDPFAVSYDEPFQRETVVYPLFGKQNPHGYNAKAERTYTNKVVGAHAHLVEFRYRELLLNKAREMPRYELPGRFLQAVIKGQTIEVTTSMPSNLHDMDVFIPDMSALLEDLKGVQPANLKRVIEQLRIDLQSGTVGRTMVLIGNREVPINLGDRMFTF